MGSKIFLVLLFVVILGGVAYFFRSGAPKTAVSFLDRFNFASSTSYSAPRFQSPYPEVAEPQNLSGQNQPVPEIKPPDGFAAKDLSPYFGKVRLSVSLSKATLAASGLGEGQGVNVSGWKIKGNSGELIVPRAVPLYEPSGLGVENDVILKNGEEFIVYSGQSAIGLNLRLNKCLGYLQNYNSFDPPLPTNCPAPSSYTGFSGLSGKCQDYVSSLGGCRLPESNPDIPPNDYACRDFLDTINYKGCFDKYRYDSDFFSNEWWAWSSLSFLDERHDKVLLYDQKGLLADLYQY